MLIIAKILSAYFLIVFMFMYNEMERGEMSKAVKRTQLILFYIPMILLVVSVWLI